MLMMSMILYHKMKVAYGRYPGFRPLCSHPQRGMQFTQGCQDREGRDAAGLGIVRGDVLDREREPRRVGVDLDRMAIALEGGIGPDFRPGALGPDAGEREGGRNVHIGWEAGRGLARGPPEHAFGLLQVFDRD